MVDDPYGNPALTDEELVHGYFCVSYKPASHRCDVRWNEETGELTLEREGRVVLSTWDVTTFQAGIRLLVEPGVMIVYHFFALVTGQEPGYLIENVRV